MMCHRQQDVSFAPVLYWHSCHILFTNLVQWSSHTLDQKISMLLLVGFEYHHFVLFFTQSCLYFNHLNKKRLFLAEISIEIYLYIYLYISINIYLYLYLVQYHLFNRLKATSPREGPTNSLNFPDFTFKSPHSYKCVNPRGGSFYLLHSWGGTRLLFSFTIWLN